MFYVRDRFFREELNVQLGFCIERSRVLEINIAGNMPDIMNIPEPNDIDNHQNVYRAIILELFDIIVRDNILGFLYGMPLTRKSCNTIVRILIDHNIVEWVDMMYQKLIVKCRLHPGPNELYWGLFPIARFLWIRFFDRVEKSIRRNGLDL